MRYQLLLLVTGGRKVLYTIHEEREVAEAYERRLDGGLVHRLYGNIGQCRWRRLLLPQLKLYAVLLVS